MAARELSEQSADPEELTRKVNAIKKQFTRKETGSMAKFKNVLSQCLKSNGLEYTDLLNC